MTTEHPVTVIGKSERTELCLGGELQSSPPACAGGVELIDWSWDAVAWGYEERGDTRWGHFIVNGRYDEATGRFMTAEVISFRRDQRSLPSLGDLTSEANCPDPGVGGSVREETELDALAREVTASYSPLSVGTDETTGRVEIDVAQDLDGELQREVSDRYGAGSVCVRSLLQPMSF